MVQFSRITGTSAQAINFDDGAHPLIQEVNGDKPYAHECVREKFMLPAQWEAKQVPEGSRQRTDTVQKNTGRAAVILVVIQDALTDFRIARLHPPVEPFNRCCT